MAVRRLTELEIKARIIPTHLRWPKPGTSKTWTMAHACVDALQALVRSVDTHCFEAANGGELSASGIARRRTELCDEALAKLVNFTPFEVAEKALSDDIVALERLSRRDSQQVQMHENLTKALQDIREGIAATQRMVLDRCNMCKGAPVLGYA